MWAINRALRDFLKDCMKCVEGWGCEVCDKWELVTLKR